MTCPYANPCIFRDELCFSASNIRYVSESPSSMRSKSCVGMCWMFYSRRGYAALPSDSRARPTPIGLLYSHVIDSIETCRKAPPCICIYTPYLRIHINRRLHWSGNPRRTEYEFISPLHCNPISDTLQANSARNCTFNEEARLTLQSLIVSIN